MISKKHYLPSSNMTWTGRVDDPKDIEAFRMHQVIELINLNDVKAKDIQTDVMNFCIIGFRSDEGVARNKGRLGAAEGSKYIRKEFANLPVRFYTQAKVYDAGDVYCIDNDLEAAQAELGKAVEKILECGMLPMVLGGGHEVAFGNYLGTFDYIQQQSPKPSLGIINFDAHFDLRSYEKVSSSGTMFLQIADKCAEAQTDFSYLCLGIQQSANTISLFNTADKLGVEYILAKDVVKSKFEKVRQQLKEFIATKKHIYMTIDCDVFSAAHAPGVSALQPFGMDPETVLFFIKEVLASKKVVSLDIVEVSPRFDNDNRTAKLAAVIMFSIINTLVEPTA